MLAFVHFLAALMFALHLLIMMRVITQKMCETVRGDPEADFPHVGDVPSVHYTPSFKHTPVVADF